MAKRPVRASLVIVGDELLAGHTEDANGPFLARRLRELGHRVVRISIVPDDVDEIGEALSDACDRAELVFVCGGLGPTKDDVTAEAAARFLHRPLAMPEEAKEQIRRIYRFGKKEGYLETAEVDDEAWRMARIPKGGVVVRNDEGAAPGSVHTRADGQGAGTVYLLPGPPAELQSVFGHLVDRDLIPREEADHTVEVELATFEAPVSSELSAFDDDHPDVHLGSYPQHGEQRVVVRLSGSREEVEAAREDLIGRFEDLVIEA